MRFPGLIVTTVVLTGLAGGQTVTNPPPLCFAFNDAGTAASINWIWLDHTVGTVTVHFTAPSSATIERLDLPAIGGYQGPCMAPVGGVFLYATSAPGGPLMGPPLTTFAASFGPLEPAAGWPHFALSTPPVALAAGSSYALVIQAGCHLCSAAGAYDPAGPTPLTYQLTVGPNCVPGVGTSGSLPFALRMRGTACGPGPQASVTNFGFACTTIAFTSLTSLLPPVLGAPWFVDVNSLPNDAFHLFWSVGVNLAGTPIAGSGCQHHLDPASFYSLLLMGAEPLVSGTIPASGTLRIGFTVPAAPSLAGTVLGAQALVVTAFGTIPVGGGALAEVSNLVALTLGY